MLINLSKINKSWIPFILEKETKQQLKQIETKLNKTTFYPNKDKIFRFLNNDLNNAKYIIVGMDPYPGDYKENNITYPVATGPSFEPANYNNWLDVTNNKSIINILKTIYSCETNSKQDIETIREYIETGKFFILPPHELFDYLEEQGILFLNYALTVKPGYPRSHFYIWNDFSKQLIKYIDKNYNVKWLLWGIKAQKLETFIMNKQNIIKDYHPRTNSFYENNHSFKLMKDIDLTGKNKKR